MQNTNEGARGDSSAVSVDAAKVSGGASWLDGRELRIRIGPMEVTYEGTAAQLIDEGLIPADFKWPVGRDRVEWDSGKMSFYIFRCRPPGHKGLMRTWLDADWWVLDMRPIDRPHHEVIVRAIKRNEIAAIEWELSAQGRAARRELESRSSAAFFDDAFQGFKERIPALAKPRRTRRKTTSDGARG